MAQVTKADVLAKIDTLQRAITAQKAAQAAALTAAVTAAQTAHDAELTAIANALNDVAV